MLPSTLFTDPVAVHAWDAWFRWRDGGTLHDLTVDATWWRVANALAAVEGTLAPLLAHHLAHAFSRWELLPDERLLRYAGTGAAIDAPGAPSAVLNVGAFVIAPYTPQAYFDRSRFMDTAGLAVRLLDNATTLFAPWRQSDSLSVGVIGLANALHGLDIPYRSAEARAHAREVAIALAEGSLRASIALADERGSRLAPCERAQLAERWQRRRMPPLLVEEGIRHGVRHRELTAIGSHPRLAMLANNAADGIDAMREPAASAPSLRFGPTDRQQTLQAAQAGLCAAMQPWIDTTVSHPMTYRPIPPGSRWEDGEGGAPSPGLACLSEYGKTAEPEY
ncbi:hypothetical protein [Pseudoxanthomonas wuyuanensis]|uniref:Ribonucleoside-diphosphate reductase alpha chain n=1 Tax=Pseudoxanthomonas wuyuanensis TaxID=1073196 RepID=A0A286DA35_9GAMM|nr:hypothetical protein [Pseudoxanthomonas wuyuanensis]KAF1720520.1 hypothetical protein CSC75_10655 [Pseudoxanthomonas wuyuanensis]SOD55526.1 ribonucleoside-diphosphate reductase alpha chain [Pseudoxanthomonas wuyuanensis]